jgi:hypothetical protein
LFCNNFLGTIPFLLAPNPCDHGLWPSARSIGAYSRIRASSFKSFQSTSQQISRSFGLTNSRSRVDQQSTTTQHPTTDTHCGTSCILSSGTSKDFTSAHPQHPELLISEHFHVTFGDIIMSRHLGVTKFLKVLPYPYSRGGPRGKTLETDTCPT